MSRLGSGSLSSSVFRTYFIFHTGPLADILNYRVPSGGVGSFGPLLIKSFGFDSFQAILFNAPFGVVQFISTVGGSYVATKYHKKGPVIAFLAMFPIVGCMIMLSTPHTPDGRNTLLGGYYMISVFPGISPSSSLLSVSRADLL